MTDEQQKPTELEPCPDCGHQVSPNAIMCPGCGRAFLAAKVGSGTRTAEYFGVAIGFCIFGVLVAGGLAANTVGVADFDAGRFVFYSIAVALVLYLVYSLFRIRATVETLAKKFEREE